jgi:hypothetical protein
LAHILNPGGNRGNGRRLFQMLILNPQTIPRFRVDKFLGTVESPNKLFPLIGGKIQCRHLIGCHQQMTAIFCNIAIIHSCDVAHRCRGLLHLHITPRYQIGVYVLARARRNGAVIFYHIQLAQRGAWCT